MMQQAVWLMVCLAKLLHDHVIIFMQIDQTGYCFTQFILLMVVADRRWFETTVKGLLKR